MSHESNAPANIATAAGPHANTGVYIKSKNGIKLRDHRVRRMVAKMRLAMHWLEDADVPACRAWAEIEILSAMIFAELREKGVIKNGEARRLLNDYRLLRQTQLTYARELAMTPAARMAIKANGTRAPLDLPGAMARRVGRS